MFFQKRGTCKKLVEDSQLCAFELLAAVAGKLLLESESSASSNVAEGKPQLGGSRDRNEKVQPKDDKALKSESFDLGSFAESAFVPKISVEEHNFKGIPQAENDQVEQTTVLASSDSLKKIDCNIKIGMREDKCLDENATCKIGSSNCVVDSYNSKVESGSEVQLEDGKNQIGHLSLADTSTVNDPVGEYVNTNVQTNPESSVKFPLYRDSIPGALLQKCYNNVKLGIRDNDEISFRCNKSSTKSRPLRPQPRIVRHRVRKMMASKYWKAAPKQMDYELYNTSKQKLRDYTNLMAKPTSIRVGSYMIILLMLMWFLVAGEGMKSFYRYRKSIYARERCQRAPLKKRKLSDHSFGVAFDQEQSSDSISNLPEKGMRGEMNNSGMILIEVLHPICV